ncbi:peptide ABC transporter substrate-binding protein [Cellvibrio sp. pealriver]|uniref:peptide ABC transporter substrate-binding protein n=1 Tax=Cellvibrio sp. pealriver TaxID=1622269 RepID=UPI001E488212|nr:peptide ABC transporter substrate-binding protein [Cellvibrio sp. pealriver]
MTIVTIMRCVILAILVSGLAACERKTLVDIGTEQQILYFGNATDVTGVDPHGTNGMPEQRIMMSLFEGLVAKDPKTLEIVPAVADSWEVSADNMTYVFHIRENAKWSNGDPLTAHDFVNGWLRGLMPALGNETVTSLFVFKNAEKYYRKEITDLSLVGFKALDDHHLKIELENPTPYFLQLLDYLALFPVHTATIKKFGDLDDPANPWTKPGNFVGNGAFVLKDWVPGRSLVVKKNPYYWDKEKVRLNEIHFMPIEQLLVEERMFKAGHLHRTEWMPYAKMPVYRENKDPEYNHYAYFATYFYVFNVTKPPFDDVRVRKALAHAVDRETLVASVTNGVQNATGALTPPNTLGYTSRRQIVFDVEKARQLLAEAGYPDGKNFPVVELTYNNSEDHRKIAEAVQQMWKKTLNINVRLKNQEWKVFLYEIKNLNHDIARTAWVGDYIDPNTFLEIFTSTSGDNKSGWKNKQYDSLIKQAATIANKEERYEVFQQAEALLLDEAPFIPLYNYTTNNLISEQLKGYHQNILDYYSYKNLYLEAKKPKAK